MGIPSTSQPGPPRAVLAAAALLWLAAAVYATRLLGEKSFDDFFITYRYAWNLAAGRGFVFNPGERVFGTTAPGFGLLLALLTRLTTISIPWLGTLATSAALPAIALLALRDSRERWPEALAGGTLLVTCHYLWVQHGSEVPLTLALLLAAAALAARSPVGAGLLAGFAVWCRPDALVGAGLLGLFLWREERRLPWRYGLAAAGMVAAGLAAARLWFGQLLPHTLEAKRAQAMAQGSDWKAGAAFWPEAASQIGRFYSGDGAGDRAVLLLVLGGLGLAVVAWQGGRVLRLLAAHAAALAVAYPLLRVPAYTWYTIPMVAASLYGVCFLAGDLGRRLAARLPPGPARSAVALGAAGLAFALLFAPLLSRTAKEATRPRAFPRFTLYERTAAWLRTNSAPGDEVSYVEVGTLGYFSDRPIQDLVGLVTPRALPYLVSNDLAGAFRAHPTAFLIHHERLAVFTDPIVHHRWFRRRYDEVHREAMRIPGEALVIYRRNGLP